jgi:hypothetical protein
LPFTTPARRQPIQGITPGLCFFGHPLLPQYLAGAYSVRGPPHREPREVTPFPVPMVRILRTMLSTGFLGSAYRSSHKVAGALSCVVLTPARQPLALVSANDGSTTSLLSLSIDTC